MELMKAAVLQGPKQIEVQEISRPKVRPQEVLVNVQACGICTFERRLYSGERKMRYPPHCRSRSRWGGSRGRFRSAP